MKRILLFVFVFSLFGFSAFSQAYITLVSSNSTSFYTSLDSAVYYASSGDYIYLPGSNYNIGTIEVSKQIHIIGVGHSPDSSAATRKSSLGGDFYFLDGSDGSSVSGIYLEGSIFLGSNENNQNVSNITISRSSINSIQLGYNVSTTCSNILFKENIVRKYFDGSYNSTNVTIDRCVFNYSLKNLENAVIKNCIFLFNDNSKDHTPFGYEDPSKIVSCIFENNIIFDLYPLDYKFNNTVHTLNCIFDNNLFVYNQAFPYGTNTGQNNIINQEATSIFINKTQDSFSYDQDYHLKPTSPGKNAGTDGTDIGIYGTSEPYKDGAVPSNPHVFYKNISVQDNQLSVEVKVKAQNR